MIKPTAPRSPQPQAEHSRQVDAPTSPSPARFGPLLERANARATHDNPQGLAALQASPAPPSSQAEPQLPDPSVSEGEHLDHGAIDVAFVDQEATHQEATPPYAATRRESEGAAPVEVVEVPVDAPDALPLPFEGDQAPVEPSEALPAFLLAVPVQPLSEPQVDRAPPRAVSVTCDGEALKGLSYQGNLDAGGSKDAPPRASLEGASPVEGGGREFGAAGLELAAGGDGEVGQGFGQVDRRGVSGLKHEGVTLNANRAEVTPAEGGGGLGGVNLGVEGVALEFEGVDLEGVRILRSSAAMEGEVLGRGGAQGSTRRAEEAAWRAWVDRLGGGGGAGEGSSEGGEGFKEGRAEVGVGQLEGGGRGGVLGRAGVEGEAGQVGVVVEGEVQRGGRARVGQIGVGFEVGVRSVDVGGEVRVQAEGSGRQGSLSETIRDLARAQVRASGAVSAAEVEVEIEGEVVTIKVRMSGDRVDVDVRGLDAASMVRLRRSLQPELERHQLQMGQVRDDLSGGGERGRGQQRASVVEGEGEPGPRAGVVRGAGVSRVDRREEAAQGPPEEAARHQVWVAA